ncbi:hypothetical protein [Gymnodinialimonas hymeniacidonis]|uniref:hypothetical protein n=1 Tax=Gymnodinialimonas hymeniacidonis TaxID=3126508 RepID=UPI0034C60560
MDDRRFAPSKGIPKSDSSPKAGSLGGGPPTFDEASVEIIRALARAAAREDHRKNMLSEEKSRGGSDETHGDLRKVLYRTSK